MFRYFGYTWNPAAADHATIAGQLNDAILRAEGWQSALSSPGLRVYTIGGRPGVNGVYPLSSGRGVILGRLFRRREDASGTGDIKLSVKEGDAILETDGQALIDGCWGRYVAVFRSERRGTCLLRDPSGALPSYRSKLGGVTVFFSWFEDLAALAPASSIPRADWNAIAARLVLGHLGGHETALHGVSQILPGELTGLDASPSSIVSLWSAAAVARDPIEPERDAAAAQLKQAVTRCVRAWSSCHGTILLRLSGGVDSAILLASLSTAQAAARVTCLNYHSPGSDSDERGFARLAATMAGVELVERERDTGFRLEDVLAWSRTPAPESYIGRMGTGRIDAEVAAMHGARTMFTGLGGDQVFFQLRGTWPAADYLHAHGLGRGFLPAALDAARLGGVSLLQATRRALVDWRRGGAPFEGAGPRTLLAQRDAIAGARDLARYVHPELLRVSDLPVGKLRQVQELINPFGYYDPYLREAAPELVNPLLSQPLVELCLRLPTWLLTQGGRGRALARRAFAHDIPREIANRQSKGGMEEHVALILDRNLAFARELLLEGQLVSQGLLDRRKVETALANRLSDRGENLSEIHDCIAVEAWLQRMATAPRTAAA